MANKMTKMEVINLMLNDVNVKANADYVAYLENEKAILTKKALNKKATAKQTENEGIKGAILDALAEVDKATIAEIKTLVPDLADASPQKVSALLSQLVKAEKVVKDYEKKVPYFSVA